MLSSSWKHFFKYHLPAILAAIGIIILSSISDLSPITKDVSFGDKIMHMIEYGIFSLLVWWSLFHIKNKTISKYSPLIAFGIAVLWGGFDEIYQSSIEGRVCDYFDWFADILGAGITQTLIILINYNWIKETS